jgi:hypothetical protein
VAVRTAWTGAAVGGELVSRADILSIPGGWLGHAQVAAAQAIATGTETDLTGLTLTVTVAASRRIKLSAAGLITRTVADGASIGRFKEGATELGRWAQSAPSAITESDQACGFVVLTPSAGAHTYKLTLQRFSGTGSVSLSAGATNPADFLIEDIGPA